MRLIIGLGNPEEEYAGTRHNMGFDTINYLSKKYDIALTKRKMDALYGSGEIEGEKVILLKPQTYMNLSGKSIRQWMEFYKITSSDIIVIYDDMDIEKGKIKLRKKGGPGTHNGMRSIVSELQSEDFCRVRVGIGTPEYKTEMVSYVIGTVSKEEKEILEKATEEAGRAVVEILKYGLDVAMNKFN